MKNHLAALAFLALMPSAHALEYKQATVSFDPGRSYWEMKSAADPAIKKLWNSEYFPGPTSDAVIIQYSKTKI